jgi:outer membrane protein OmpA-like peptidoglycan-associated protein
MRSPLFLAWCLAGALVLRGEAQAQVTLNPDALKQLQVTKPVAAPLARPATAKPVAPAVPRVAPPEVATIPPEIATLPPSPVVPTRPPAKVIPPVPLASAVGDATPIKNGLRLDFGPSSSDLNPAMDRALRNFAKQAAPGPVNLDAYAAGNNSDPSTPRRLSLARALAARAVLIDAGLASKMIYIRAHAPNSATSPADRLEITLIPPRS